MKYIVIILIALSIILIGCEPVLNADTIPVTIPPETVVITQVVTNTEYIEIENTEKIDELEKEISDYKGLISIANILLSNVYYGYAENDKYILDGFTAFSLAYNDKCYIITAGHCVDSDDAGKMTDFKFKANFSNEWIYPKLLKYENDFSSNNDYAIFYSDKINDGLNYDTYNKIPYFILGAVKENALKIFLGANTKDGESGSPVINIDGEVVGIATGDFVDIDIVLQAIDTIK